MTDNRFEVTLGKAEVTIGDGAAGSNEIEAHVSNLSGTEIKCRIRLEIRYGDTTEALVARGETFLQVELGSTEDGSALDLLDLEEHTEEGLRVWQTPQPAAFAVQFGAAATFVLRVSRFVCNTRVGSAKLKLVITPLKEDPETHEISVPKSAGEADAPELLYFHVDKDFVLPGGDGICLAFAGTGLHSYSLRRNNQLVREWPSPREGGPVQGSFKDSPSITTTYRLTAHRTNQCSPDDVTRTLTVQVIAPGWNRIGLPQGYPSALFVAEALTGEGGPRLYGVFVGRDGKATLHSSATGLDDWRPERGTVPEGMHDSPCVAFNGKLWLIGGSCCDENAVRGAVWCYDRAEDAEDPAWNERKDLALGAEGNPPARMGHACIAVPPPSPGEPPELWLIGGYDANGRSLDDVWVLHEGGGWTQQQDAPPGWAGRRMHAAACLNGRSGEREVWLFGGVGQIEGALPRDIILSDFWSWSKQGWKKREGFKPSQGAPLASTFITRPGDPAQDTADRDRLFLAGTFLCTTSEADQLVFLSPDPTSGERLSNITRSRLFERQPALDLWEAEDVLNGWDRFEGSWFRMQGVAFNGLLLIWSLNPAIDPGKPPRLNVLVP